MSPSLRPLQGRGVPTDAPRWPCPPAPTGTPNAAGTPQPRPHRVPAEGLGTVTLPRGAKPPPETSEPAVKGCLTKPEFSRLFTRPVIRMSSSFFAARRLAGGWVAAGTGTGRSDGGRAAARHTRKPPTAPTHPGRQRREEKKKKTNRWASTRSTKRNAARAGSWHPTGAARGRGSGRSRDPPCRSTCREPWQQHMGPVHGAWVALACVLAGTRPASPWDGRTDSLSPAPGCFSIYFLISHPCWPRYRSALGFLSPLIIVRRRKEIKIRSLLSPLPSPPPKSP